VSCTTTTDTNVSLSQWQFHFSINSRTLVNKKLEFSQIMINWSDVTV